MTAELTLCSIDSDEQLARFVLHRDWIRRDNTLRPQAFLPHPYIELSVTRHVGLSDTEIWAIGERVAGQQKKNLYGRADVIAADVTKIKLKAIPVPLLENRNHAEISGWPPDKPTQMSYAQLLAADSKFVAIPNLRP